MTKRILIMVGLVVFVVGAWWLWQAVRAPKRARPVSAARPYVRLAGADLADGDGVLAERAKIFDPTPLFLPTPRNYRHLRLPDRLKKRPGQIFGDYDAKLSANLPSLSTGAAAETLVDILARANEVPFAGLGERAAEREPLPQRVAMMEIKSLAPGRFSRAAAVEGVIPPRRDFGPMEFLVSVGTAGLIGEPVLVSGSGWPEVDVFFREFLVSRYQLGARLGPGRYRVMVGP